MKLRHQFERAAFWLVRSAGGVIPRSIFLWIGRKFGMIAYTLDRRHRQIALANFQSAFASVPESTRANTIRECYEFFGMYLFDLLTYYHRPARSRMDEFEWEGLEYLDDAYRCGKGTILYTAHFGPWEIMAIAQGLQGYSLGVIARPLDNCFLQRLLLRLRTSTGNFVIEKNAAFRSTLRALRQGKGIAILIDQNVSTDDRIFVDFFRKAAATTPALALLKLKTDAVIIPAFALPIEGNRYRFIYGKPLEFSLTGNRAEDVLRITERCTAVVEQQIAAHPQYWLWMHRRWKTRPQTDAELNQKSADQRSAAQNAGETPALHS